MIQSIWWKSLQQIHNRDSNSRNAVSCLTYLILIPYQGPPRREAGQGSPAESANLKYQWEQFNLSITMSLRAELACENSYGVWHWLRAADVLMSYSAAYSCSVCVCWVAVERGYFRRSGRVLKILLQRSGAVVRQKQRNTRAYAPIIQQTISKLIPRMWANTFRHGAESENSRCKHVDVGREGVLAGWHGRVGGGTHLKIYTAGNSQWQKDIVLLTDMVLYVTIVDFVREQPYHEDLQACGLICLSICVSISFLSHLLLLLLPFLSFLMKCH